ncbi:DUF72 domain-containing protein [Phenylobacterium deserti]|uniref:DUF72 domain-containing protein n=1 Tax=Phenylobacterium deserti TaxID=1914756 RepID=A0A328ATA7_9CAUL|nr:DUF72 domain-containing protein [Phenylobacterium deserti]RAK57505.1 DUF72 domain-containing protein [Phenylobacterium deserti]
MSQLRIGCSGWVYKDWKGPFYPPETKDKDRLAYYATRFDTAEINASFYRLPSEAMVAGWAERAPQGFTYAWKVSRFITHNKKLKDAAEAVELVFGRMQPLGEHYGPALIQLPPQLRRNDDRLAQFLSLLPKGRRHTVEFRHESWYDPAVFAILADHDAALCISDHHSAPSPWEVTASWVYVRGHGPGGRYFGRYPDEELTGWARQIEAWRQQGRDVYAYFDNDIKSAAPFDAETLMRLAGAQPYG